MVAPTLETERLLLRAHTAGDFEACLDLWSNETVVHYITGRASTPQEVWARLLRYAGHWQFLGYGYFLAVEKASGSPVGEFGVAEYHRRPQAAGKQPPEAGWVLMPRFHGYGLAYEAMTAVLGWAAGQGVTETTCRIDPANVGSLRLAGKLGYSQFDRLRDGEFESLLLRRIEGTPEPAQSWIPVVSVP